ncbi:aldehyde dehydrogenase 1A1-like isoform X1 [Schistocerca gregaria]|uniref:aldehyde dehydrogenase 1A1-like isoform X1 n=2 Tax=Schistocerca gregaria TaxID=7010 RepID=UPI00211E48F6|nr:aldehyde dehydrogenase 1A1-like isoform X1 [Schistocerca gregaria]
MAENRVTPKYTQLFINNEFVDSASGKKFPVINPSTGETIADVAEGDKIDIDRAVAAAKAAFNRKSEWRQMDASARAKLMNKLADLIERDAQQLGNLLTAEGGKLYYGAYYEAVHTANTLRYFSGWCDKITGKTIPADGPFFTYTRKEPVGVVGQIVPWNFPLTLTALKWGPALATGCTIVLKPAEQTPLCILYLAALTKEAGFPNGVINVVPGYGPTAGAAVSSHPDIAKVAFTGSTQVGKIIMETAAKSNLKKVSLELGGKSPLIVLDDADVDEAVQIAHDGIFMHQGQICCAGSRTYVHEKLYDEFVQKSKIKAEARKIGDPFDNSVQHGPQIDEDSFKKVMDYIKSGKEQGAHLECGGVRFGDKGYFVKPTVFSNVTDDMKIAREEIFGPVQSIIKFKTIEEVIERANDTLYGLAAGVITNDINKALTIANALEAGSVWVNCFFALGPQSPFGGYKLSGLGRECGEESLDEYLEVKTVAVKLPVKL